MIDDLRCDNFETGRASLRGHTPGQSLLQATCWPYLGSRYQAANVFAPCCAAAHGAPAAAFWEFIIISVMCYQLLLGCPSIRDSNALC